MYLSQIPLVFGLHISLYPFPFFMRLALELYQKSKGDFIMSLKYYQIVH